MDLTATTALPYQDLERATAGLRAELRHQAVELGQQPNRLALEITGPVEVPDALGRPWFEYQAVVQGR